MSGPGPSPDTPEADLRWMRRALGLAARGRGKTSPNPMVGAVLVRGERVVGEGYHRRAGRPHAEIIALEEAGKRARGATLYVTLEPCCHWGRTPPCTDALIEAGVSRVVAASKDANPQVSGRGLGQLRKAGMAVEVGLLEAEARRLNAAHFKHAATGLPLLSLKTAMSLDGKIATSGGESQWITGEKARAAAHRLRSAHDAVLVGVGTALADDPRLTARAGRGRSPLRVVADSQARTPPDAQLLTADERPPIIGTTRRAPKERVRALEAAGAEVLQVRSQGGHVALDDLLRQLAERDVRTVLLEGGGKLAGSALAAGLVDRVYFFLAPLIIGGESAPTAVGGPGARRLSEAWRLESVKLRRLGEDYLLTGDISRGEDECSPG